MDNLYFDLLQFIHIPVADVYCPGKNWMQITIETNVSSKNT